MDEFREDSRAIAIESTTKFQASRARRRQAAIPTGCKFRESGNGAIAPPMDDPLSKSAVANPRSLFGNHSDTALVAAGQFADSPAPSRNRKKAKLCKPRASGVSIDTTEYAATVRVIPRRVPTRSIRRPQTVCPSGIGNPKRDYDGGVVGVGPVEIDLKKWRENRKGLPVKVVNYGGGEEQHADRPSKGMCEIAEALGVSCVPCFRSQCWPPHVTRPASTQTEQLDVITAIRPRA